MQLQQFPDLISSQEINQILSWLDCNPWSTEKYRDVQGQKNLLVNRHKNLDFHLEDSLVRQILLPKLEKILSNPIPTHGGFLESHYPYSLHVDTPETFKRKKFEQTYSDSVGRAVLIPLNDHPDFQTVFFDFYTDDLVVPEVDLDLPTPVYDGVIDLSHLGPGAKALLKNNDIKLSGVVNWKKGHAFSWMRNQLHCSGNFYQKGIKHALVLFF